MFFSQTGANHGCHAQYDSLPRLLEDWALAQVDRPSRGLPTVCVLSGSHSGWLGRNGAPQRNVATYSNSLSQL